MTGPVDVEGCRDRVEECEHREDGAEDREIYGRGVAGDSFCDHVADYSHDEERPEELIC